VIKWARMLVPDFSQYNLGQMVVLFLSLFSMVKMAQNGKIMVWAITSYGSVHLSVNWHVLNLQPLGCYGLQPAFKILVYTLKGISYAQVVRTILPSWSVGRSDARDLQFETNDDKSSFSKRRGGHVHFFLLLPNDTSAPWLGQIV
jgi:hypothetical protein